MSFLPSNWFRGRGATSGPVAGGYATFGFGPLVTIADGTDVIVGSFIAPCDLRLSKFAWSQNIVATTSSSIKIFKHPTTVQTSGATLLQTTAGGVDTKANLSGLIVPVGETGGIDTLVENLRNISSGTRVFVTMSAVSANAAMYFNCYFQCWLSGHANILAAND